MHWLEEEEEEEEEEREREFVMKCEQQRGAQAVQQQRGVKHTPPPGDHCWFSHKEERTKAAASCFE